MTPAEAKHGMDAALARIHEQATPNTAAIVEVARHCALAVKQAAAHDGTAVGIRVYAHDGGVRMTVIGPHAGRYRDMLRHMFDQEMPQAVAEIRAQVVGHLS
ncbi:MAG: hypothetical protein ABI934_11725 [Actinomycetota bacterium]